ncbi:glycosyltransferase [Zoogloea sp.]|uniref:glycosyltransferase n=1 Tax=Zoogloea sp. TaxID=49181 RepID=UPI0035B2E8CD
MNTSPIDVIVPVYRGLAETQRCIQSVLRSQQQTPFELIAINDAGPEPALTAWLRELAAAGRLTLLENETNLGFVRTVNRGMSLHADRDVVLLNSDTEVANDWLDRLAACAARNPQAGTLTPFSNNATICSYPFEGWTGGVPGTLGLAGLDSLIATTLTGQVVHIPTGVGFCMYIRRTCLDEVGLFDAERFGRGYGEENDFCRRAAARGWHNLLAADVFVFHEGGVSFSEERAALQDNAMKRLLEAHPDYLEVVRAFITRDPTAPLRQAVDRARCACGGAEEAAVLDERSGGIPSPTPVVPPARPVQLHISHSWGGGTDRWILDYCRTDTTRRNLLLRSRSHRNAAGFRIELVEPAADAPPLLAWDLALPIRACSPSHPEYAALLDAVLTDFHVASIVVSSLIGHSLEALSSGVPTVVVLHDLFPFCPALFACYDGACSDCPPARLKTCLLSNPLNVFWHNTADADWHRLRSTYAALIARPEVQVVAPSSSIHERWASLQPALADKPWTRVEHGIALPPAPSTPRPPAPAGRRPRLLVPGRLAPHKGLSLLRQALPALCRQADILLLGSGDFGRAFKGMAGIEVIEHYEHAALPHIVRDFAPDLALLVSILPESFSYTLSEMFALGIPVAATRIGAFAERIDDGLTGLLFAPNADALIAVVSECLSHPGQLEALRRNLAARPVRGLIDMVADYNGLLPPPGTGPEARAAGRRLDTLHRRAIEDARRHQEASALRDAVQQQAAALSARDERIAHLEEQVQHLDTRMRELHASRSWRLSAPLRVLGRGARRFAAATPPGPADTPPPPPTAARPQPLPVLDTAARREVRERVRHWFGIPDRGRILLSLGTPADSTTAQRYLALVQPLTAARNDLCAIFAGVTPDAPCWNDCREDMATLVATRQLFLAESLHDRDAFLLAADAFLALDAGSLERDGANAVEAGLLVLCPTGCNTPFGQATTAPGQVIDAPSADAACAALHAWLDATPRD